MNARELVTVLVQAFRASPARDNGNEAMYRMHQLRGALEHVLAHVREYAARAALDQDPETERDLRLGLAWRDLLRAAQRIEPAPSTVRVPEWFGEMVGELVTCEHELQYHELEPRVPRFVRLDILKDDRALRTCGRCGARKDDDGRGWHRPELVEAIAKRLDEVKP